MSKPTPENSVEIDGVTFTVTPEQTPDYEPGTLNRYPPIVDDQMNWLERIINSKG